MLLTLGVTLLVAFQNGGVLADKPKRFNEIKIRDDAVHNDYGLHALPHEYIQDGELPEAFSWDSVRGRSYLTHSLNQHLPQYCGSCWAHGSLSSLSDRIKIAREFHSDGGAAGDDINLSIQYILNCGTKSAGSCHGGYHTSTYEFIKTTGYVPYDTCMPYLACSDESTEGFCPHLDTTCSSVTTCKTCDTFAGMGGSCSEISYFPNATVLEYGLIKPPIFHNGWDDHIHKIKSEIYARGPVAATINAEPIVEYTGGVFVDDTHSTQTNHIVSIVGWGYDEDTDSQYWVIRNSWGQYWGEMGYMKLQIGKNLLGIEGEVAWATPGQFTTHNTPCYEDGKNCGSDQPRMITQHYQDPAKNIPKVQERLLLDKQQSTSSNTKSYIRSQ